MYIMRAYWQLKTKKKKKEKLNVPGPADYWNLYLASPLDFFVVPDQRTTTNFEPCRYTQGTTNRPWVESNSLSQAQHSECGGKADMPFSFRPPGSRWTYLTIFANFAC